MNRISSKNEVGLTILVKILDGQTLMYRRALWRTSTYGGPLEPHFWLQLLKISKNFTPSFTSLAWRRAGGFQVS
jgi:hypothetical protein